MEQENKDKQIARGPLPLEVSSAASEINMSVHLLPSETSDQRFLEVNDIHVFSIIFISTWKSMTRCWAQPCKNKSGFLRWDRHSSLNWYYYSAVKVESLYATCSTDVMGIIAREGNCANQYGGDFKLAW